MTINITPEIRKAFDAFLDEPIDCDLHGTKIRRRATWPYSTYELSGLVEFAAGWAAAAALQETNRDR